LAAADADVDSDSNALAISTVATRVAQAFEV
jgi:hypothetical protein